MSNQIKLGYEHETAERVDVPIIHSVLTGITRHGKSETMQAMVDRAVAHGYTVLLFDTKAKRDYAGIGTEVPVYFEETAEPITVKSLLDDVVDAPVSVDFAELVKVHEKGDDYATMLRRVRDAIDDDRHPVEENKLIVIEHLLEKLVSDLGEVEITDELELVEGTVNVMDLHNVDESVQQIAIASTARAVNSQGRESIIVGVDESHNFIPQRGSPPANGPLVDLIREGGASDVWVWFSDQTVTGIDKDPLKQVDLWLFGRQREQNEVDRVRDQIGKSEYSDADVKEMPKGHFVVDTGPDKIFTYIQPAWMDDETAEEIARGTMTPEDTQEPDTDDVQDIEEELQEKEETIRELEAELESRDEEIRELQSDIAKLNDLLEDEEDAEPAPTGPGVDEEQVRAIVEDYIEEYEVPEEVRVEAKQSSIHVRRTVEPVEVTTDDLLGKVAYLYAEGELPDSSWFTTGDVEDILARHGLDATVKRSKVLNQMARVGFLEKRTRADGTREYRIVMPPDVARSEGLLQYETSIQA